jgi:predicted ATPase
VVIRELRVRDYRSIRRLHLPIGELTTIVGENGSGKSNLYKSLMLLAACANGDFAKALAAEGGMPSAIWAGRRAKGSVRMTFGITLDAWAYDIECGLPTPTQAALPFDPIVKSETLSFSRRGQTPVAMLKRRGPSIMLRNESGRPSEYPLEILAMETALSSIQDPQQFPELAAVVNAFRGWRFYHHFRTDQQSPLRMPQVGVCTPTMSSDGSDLAAVLQSVISISDGYEIRTAVEEAFPGSQLQIFEQRGRLEVGLQVPGLNRPLTASELSDGTLRYLCLIGALLSLRLPPLVVLNEPETSLHPDLLAPLARLIQRAVQRTQVWVITHSDALAANIEEHSCIPAIKVRRENGETKLSGGYSDETDEEDDED